jgi:hypothetical protein
MQLDVEAEGSMLLAVRKGVSVNVSGEMTGRSQKKITYRGHAYAKTNTQSPDFPPQERSHESSSARSRRKVPLFYSVGNTQTQNNILTQRCVLPQREGCT